MFVLVLSVTVVFLLASQPVRPAALALTVLPKRGRGASPRFDAWRLAHAMTDQGAHNRGGQGTEQAAASGRSARPAGPPSTTRSARSSGWRDPLAAHRATMGPDVQISFLRRLRAVILLVLIVASIGAAIAGVTLLAIASGRFVLELLAG